MDNGGRIIVVELKYEKRNLNLTIMSYRTDIVQRDSGDIKEIDKGAKNVWRWEWMEHVVDVLIFSQF